MKAVDFIRKFGWDDAKWLKSECEHSHDVKKSSIVNYDELKQYIDAWELVNRFGGVDGAKDEYFDCVQNNEPASHIRKAIELVESVENKDDLTDHCTNIKNHVSPLTKVIDK